MSHNSSGLVRYAGSTGIIEDRNPAMPNVLALCYIRTTKDDFEGAGVVGALVKQEDGSYLVQITKQYSLGGQHYLEHKVVGSDLRNQYKFLRGMMRKCFSVVVSRKFSELLGESLSV